MGKRLRLNGLVLLAAVVISLALAPQTQGVTSLSVINVSAGPGGIVSTPGGPISGSGSFVAQFGSSVAFAIIPDPGFSILDVVVDGVSRGPVSEVSVFVRFPEHAVGARFIECCTVTARAGSGGFISPSGAVHAPFGASSPFHIGGEVLPLRPSDPRFVISDVLIDGTSMGPDAVSDNGGVRGDFVFENVRDDHTIEARFSVGHLIVVKNDDANGFVEPVGKQPIGLVLDEEFLGLAVGVIAGGSQTFTITPTQGFIISDVLVDGVSVGKEPTFTFENVTADRTIEAVFLEVFPALAPALELILDDD
jgi:hypothetical protein